MWRRYAMTGLTAAILICLSTLGMVDAANKPTDAEWPQWRGPNRDGVSTEKGLLKSWGPNGPKKLWEAKGLGSGYSSVVIHDGHVVTMGKRDGKLNLTAVAVKDGSPLWSSTLLEKADNAPNCTPTIGDGL